MQPDPNLLWYYQTAPRELGLRAAPLSNEPRSNVPSQNWPSAAMCSAARRQKRIREALRQLSGRLQSVLECAYESRPMSLSDRHKYDLAAPLIARVLECAKAEDERDAAKIRSAVKALPVLLDAAHRAFHIAFDKSKPSSRHTSVQSRISRWEHAEIRAAS